MSINNPLSARTTYHCSDVGGNLCDASLNYMKTKYNPKPGQKKYTLSDKSDKSDRSKKSESSKSSRSQVTVVDPDPVDCVGEFGAFSACSTDTGAGCVQTRSYSVTVSAQFGGFLCDYSDGYEETVACPCAVNCVGSFGGVGECFDDGDGTCSHSQTYIIKTEAAHGGEPCEQDSGFILNTDCDCPDTGAKPEESLNAVPLIEDQATAFKVDGRDFAVVALDGDLILKDSKVLGALFVAKDADIDGVEVGDAASEDLTGARDDVIINGNLVITCFECWGNLNYGGGLTRGEKVSIGIIIHASFCPSLDCCVLIFFRQCEQ